MKYLYAQTVVLFTIGTIFIGGQAILAKPETKADPSSKPLSRRQQIERDQRVFDEKIKSLPVLFEENKGQFAEQTKYFSRGNGFDLFLTSDQAVYQMPDPTCQRRTGRAEREPRVRCKAVSLKMKMLGANPEAVIHGVDRAVTKSSYAVGNDQSKWLNDVSNYHSVVYQNVYSGVDLVFRGAKRTLEYDFRLAPEADPNLIQLKFDGAKKFRIDADGNLVFKLKGVELNHQKPVAYQIVDGDKVAVNVSYALLGKNRIGFKIGNYDRNRELIIDPIVYASYLGYSSGGDSVNDIAVDRQGNIYTASDFRYSITQNNVTYTYSDVMISKFNPEGTQRLWVKVVGGSQDDVPYGMDVDGSGRVYVTGVTYSPNFPLNFAEQSSHPINNIDSDFTGFVLRLDGDGETSYSTYLGGSTPAQYGQSIVADPSANAYVTGFTCSSDFPIRNGFQNSLQGACNAFLTKLDSFGHITYSTFFGSNNSIGADVFTDGSGIAYVTGGAGNGVFTTSGAYATSGEGFVAKFDTDRSGSNSLVYSTRVPKSGAAIAVDVGGNAWVAMSQSGFVTGQSAQVIKLNNAGGGLLVEAQAFGTQIRDIAVDGNGSAYFAYNFSGANRIASKVTALRPSGEEIDGFTIDATRDEKVYGITLGPEADTVYVGGSTTSLNFPTTIGAYQPTSNAPNIFFGQGFLAKVQLNTPNEKEPLIFIPGIMGSHLRGPWYNLDVPFWINVNQFETESVPSVYNLTLDGSSPNYTDGLYASDVIKKALYAAPMYENLLDSLASKGYKTYEISRHVYPNQGCDLSQRSSIAAENPSLFVFPYDWRQDNNYSADKLREYVQCVQQFYRPGTKVNILAHSMGGLVARRYVLQAQTRNEPHGLGKVVTLATPYLGASEAISKIYTGGSWEFPASYVALSPKVIKFLSPHMPSMHQLFPSRTYHQFTGGIIRESGDVNGNGIPDENYSFSQFVQKLDSDFPETAPGTVGAGFHDLLGQDNWQNDESGIEYFHIAAAQNQLNTTVGLAVKNSILCRLAGNTTLTDCRNGVRYIPRKGLGDKTVPTISATRSVGNVYLGSPNSRCYVYRSPSPNNAEEKKAEHTEMTKQPIIQDLVSYFLGNTAQQPSSSQVTDCIPSNAFVSNLSYLGRTTPKNNAESVSFINSHYSAVSDLTSYAPSQYLIISGTTEVTVRDETGNTASIQENGLLDNQVAGLMNYEMVGEDSIMLTFSLGHTYTIEFGSGTTPLGFDLVEGVGNEQPTKAVRYNDVSVSSGLNIEFTISPDGSGELRYDANGDGEFETSVLPTVSVSGPVAGDIAPPTVDIEVSQQGNRATATISAQDDQSGIAVIWYSLDGQTFQRYASPIMLQYSPNPIRITAFADDLVANRSGLYSKEFTFPPSINPTVSIASPANGSVFPIGTTVSFGGNFSDDQCDAHTAVWTFDNLLQIGAVNEVTREVAAGHTFMSSGVYLVTLTVSNNCGGTGTASTVGDLTAMVVVYDPSAGFVTGGGWIDSPIGAYRPNPNLTGRASFGFNSKYQRGANIPTGNTEFQFRVANFNFRSTRYDWLVVGGAKAQYKGSGTINNAGDFGFMLTAIDGQINGGGGQDKFRIKVWDKTTNVVVYDNQFSSGDNDNPTTVIGGGSIIIHR